MAPTLRLCFRRVDICGAKWQGAGAGIPGAPATAACFAMTAPAVACQTCAYRAPFPPAQVNIGLPAAAPGADGSAAMAAAEAQAVRQRSYAIRRLQAFIHLGQTVLNEKRADAAAAEGAPPAGGAVQSVVGVDAEYLLDQALMDRAWRTLQE